MSIAHRVVGSGPRTVIVSHGWFGSSEGWGLFPDYLDGEANTYLFADLRGYGARKDVEGSQTLDEIADDLIALADEHGAERFALVGHSMSGAFIQRVLAKVPDRVEALVALSPVSSSPFPFDDAGRELFWGAVDDRDKRYAIIDFTTGNRNSPVWVNRMVDFSLANSTRDAFANALEAWAGPDFADEVRGSDVPVLVLVGEHDPALSEDFARAHWLPLFTRAKIEVIPNAGHYAMFETPVNLATRIDNFLKEIGS
ncbi:alpha/beta hydrolase [Intrasporangium calvum]|uniref:Alpha/beta hydrolase n=1 Tax=Intrasporangium calvum TaxID=53358 RepID=A0ABT5GMA1_9MICO|nr:alpha/beta hydrolase [Intrasporangium calvum]MDC5699368.1 alpha/beta hydrolase [Intrasporangium calvum]